MTEDRLPDPDTIKVPDIPEPIVAYRTWQIAHDGHLVSPMFPTPWPTRGPLIAHCKTGMVTIPGTPYTAPTAALLSFPAWLTGYPAPPREQAPQPAVSHIAVHAIPCPPNQVHHHGGHGCGIYGIRRAEEVQWRLGGGPPTHVYGEVWLSGEVLEYSDGYRASRATPKALWYPHNPNSPHELGVLEAAAALYDIPLINPPPPTPIPPIAFAGQLQARLQANVALQAHVIRQVQQALSGLKIQYVFGGPVSAAQPTPTPPAPSPVHHPDPQAQARIRAARARKWAGGLTAAATLELVLWRRGDLLWHRNQHLVLAVALTHLACAAGWAYIAHKWARLYRPKVPDA